MMYIIVFFCVLMLCTFDYDVVTAVCQLLINGYVMLCYVNKLFQRFRVVSGFLTRGKIERLAHLK